MQISLAYFCELMMMLSQPACLPASQPARSFARCLECIYVKQLDFFFFKRFNVDFGWKMQTIAKTTQGLQDFSLPLSLSLSFSFFLLFDCIVRYLFDLAMQIAYEKCADFQ